MTEKLITKINENFINELNVCSKILLIPSYFNHFNPIIKYNVLSFAKIDKEYIKKISTKNNNKDKYMIYIKKYDNNELKTFYSFFYDITFIKPFFKQIVETYIFLLKSFQLLNNNNICYFDLNFDKFFFNKYHIPIINNFEKSILYDDVSFLKTCNNLNTYLEPLELHVISFLNKYDNISLSFANIEDICKKYIFKLKSHIKINFPDDFYNNCVESLLCFVNKSKNNIIDNLVTYIHTWDAYKLNILYLQIIGVFFEQKEDNIFFKHLLLNIEPNVKKRMSFDKTIENFENIINSDINWNFVSELKREKVIELFSILS